MSAETEDNVSQEIETEARNMGWVPREDFRGAEDKWVDANEFVERGKHVMPLLKKNNERLESQVGHLTQQLTQLRGELETTKTGLEEQREFYEEQLVERVKQERVRLKGELKQAREEGDLDREVEITDELGQLNAAEKDVKGKLNGKEVVPNRDTPSNEQLTPEFLSWKAQNTWFETDADRRFEAMQLAEKIIHDVNMRRSAPLQGQAFFAELDRRLNAPKGSNRQSKVEGSRGGATSSTSNARTYADLPAEAKAICDREARRFVKPNGLWKTEGDYRKHYVEVLERTGFFSQ
jgi:hypothetical protein